MPQVLTTLAKLTETESAMDLECFVTSRPDMRASSLAISVVAGASLLGLKATST